jgi:hypothetical protein
MAPFQWYVIHFIILLSSYVLNVKKDMESKIIKKGRRSMNATPTRPSHTGHQQDI